MSGFSGKKIARKNFEYPKNCGYNRIDFDMERNIGFKERRYIEELRILTKSTAFDCVIDDRFDRVIYVIRQGDMGLAIGKKGENIKRLQSVLGKRIEMVEYAETPEEFIINIFKPAEVVSIERDAENGPLNVFVKQRSDLGIAIGKAGCNIEKARILSKRFFGLDVGEVLLEREEG
jgi:N utilization substance protein A